MEYLQSSLNSYNLPFSYMSWTRPVGHLAAIGRRNKIASSAVVRQRNGGVGVGEEGSEGGGRDALSQHCEEPFSSFHRNVIASRKKKYTSALNESIARLL